MTGRWVMGSYKALGHFRQAGSVLILYLLTRGNLATRS